MGIRSRFVAVAAGYVVFLPLASRVHAGVATLELSAGGAEVIVVSPGEAFSIDVILNAPEGMVHNSSLFSLVFTQAGLSYEGYSWAEPYENQTNFDFSSPLWSDLPLLIGPGLNPGPTSEVVLSNVVRSGEFSSGLLVSLSLRVPDDWTEMTNIGIAAFPDTFANGFEEMPVSAAGGVLVMIVPSPSASLVCLFIAALRPRPRRPLHDSVRIQHT